MLHSATRLFVDLSVGKKLLVGFGLVLMLTVAVMASGFVAVQAVLKGHAQSASLSTIDAQILGARRMERDYAISHSEADAQRMREQLAQVRAGLAEQMAAATPAERERLQAMDLATADYLQQFDTSVQHQARAYEARKQMDDAAQEARSQFEMIELDMYDAVRELRLAGDQLRGSDPLTLAETASNLSKRMLELRSHESRFIIDGSAAALEDWNFVSYDLQSAANGLMVWLNEDQKRAIEAALVALTNYQQAFTNFQQVHEQSLASDAAMLKQADQVLALSEQAKNIEEQAMGDDSRNALLLLGSMGLVAVLIGLFAAFTISRSIVAPLRQTVEFARRIAGGDLSQDLPQNRRDELGQLLEAMQGMTRSLRDLVGRIGNGVGQIAAAAEQLSAITAQTSAGVQNQKVETEQTATAMHEMAATVQEVAQNAEQASLAAADADREAQQGNQVVQQAISQIGKLAQEVEQSAEAMQELNQESGRIGSVLEVIRAVAEQTNLLALNAAIEAARAGDQGRGFAVVADEVRALARRTHDSTQEIETLIANLQRLAHGAATQMEGSRELTQRTVALAGEAGDALGRITQAVSTIEQMNQQIAAAAEEQSAVAETISESVTRVRDIGEQSASASQQTATSSAELARLGVELQGLVRQFRT